MEIISAIERRRRWRAEEKLRIVAEAGAPGAVFALVTRHFEVSRGQLWKWRTQVRSGELVAAQPDPEFIPVRVMAAATQPGSQPRPADAPLNAPDQPDRPHASITVEDNRIQNY